MRKLVLLFQEIDFNIEPELTVISYGKENEWQSD